MITVQHWINFDFFGEEAKAFFARAKFKPYQNPLWLATIEKTLGENENPFFIAFLEGERLIALLPLACKSSQAMRTIVFQDYGVSDENDMLYDPAALETLKADKSLYAKLLAVSPPSDLFLIDKVNLETSVFTQIFPQFKTHFYRYSTHKLALDAPFDALRESKYNGTHRRTLDKKGGKLARKGKLLLEEVLEISELEKTFAAFLALRAFRFKGQTNDMTQDPRFAAFYLAYAKAGVAQKLARTMRLTLDGEILGVAIGLTCENAYQIVMLGFDRDKYANWSPGLVLVDKLIEDGIKRGETHVDLTIGDEPYKYLFGVESTQMAVLYLPLTLKGRVYAFARFKGALVKRYVLQLYKRFFVRHATALKKAYSSRQTKNITQVLP